MSESSNNRLGFSGRLASRFLTTEITLLLALLGLFLGLFAVLVTPREEEPQINVTFANVFIAFPGASAKEVESLVSAPAEQIMSEISGVKHVYSVSRPGLSILTVEYEVGEDRTQAIVRLYNKIFSNSDWYAQDMGVAPPVIKPKGIDDVPIVSLTLWTDDDKRSSYDLLQVAHALEAELKRVPGTRDVFTIGGAQQVVHVRLDTTRLSAYGLSLNDLRAALTVSNASNNAGFLVHDNSEIQVTAGRFLSSAEEVAGLVVSVKDNRAVYLRDIADISFGPAYPKTYVSHGHGLKQHGETSAENHPAVTLAIAKKPGTNAVDIANAVIERMGKLQGIFLPEGVHVSVTRNYGVTADDKARTLITKLIFATAVVVLLVWRALGRKEAFIVGTAVVITLAITLFASWAWGFTLNRVSLFALIFSIGILVDDAIVVVENIHRHLSSGDGKLEQMIPVAVDEVGGPTILATFTVIAALLPMAFVSGLMGPYMSPIPINASMGMLISLAVAFVITPWMTYKVFSRYKVQAQHAESHEKITALFHRLIGPFVDDEQGSKRRRQLGLGIGVLILLSLALVYTQHVVLKMLPFDNKSEFQVVVDMPEGTPLEQTNRVLEELSTYLAGVDEVTNYETYAGTAAPINFNGLVRQYYLRADASMGDIQVNLLDKSKRHRKSHEIARDVRGPLTEIARRYDASIKVVEIPPGPPVLSPLVAEVYGLDYPGQMQVAKELRGVFESSPGIVDIDTSIVAPAPRYILQVDRHKAALLGVSQQDVSMFVQTLLSGADMGWLHGEHFKYAVPVRVELPLQDKDGLQRLLALKIPGRQGNLVPLKDIVQVRDSNREQAIYHKDLLPVVYVTADMAGELDSPLYGMFQMVGQLRDKILSTGEKIQQFFINAPDNPYEYSMKWDGEWQITYETFRDMGIAYSVGLLLIYFLVVAQFRSYLVPLIIMAPIPLTVIGVLPGHALFGAEFTATSMIGMIALAGIIVRNSILLVDFINEQLARGTDFKTAVIQASAVRSKPIVLTALAAMLGALFILGDPIFGGLAISLIFGILVSTLLTLVVIPVMYYAFMLRRLAA